MELRVLSIRADAIIYKYNVYSIYNLVYVIIIMAWVCGRSLAGIAGSNPAGGHGCLSIVSVVCCHVEFSATG